MNPGSRADLIAGAALLRQFAERRLAWLRDAGTADKARIATLAWLRGWASEIEAATMADGEQNK